MLNWRCLEMTIRCVTLAGRVTTRMTALFVSNNSSLYFLFYENKRSQNNVGRVGRFITCSFSYSHSIPISVYVIANFKRIFFSSRFSQGEWTKSLQKDADIALVSFLFLQRILMLTLKLCINYSHLTIVCFVKACPNDCVRCNHDTGHCLECENYFTITNDGNCTGEYQQIDYGCRAWRSQRPARQRCCSFLS